MIGIEEGGRERQRCGTAAARHGTSYSARGICYEQQHDPTLRPHPAHPQLGGMFIVKISYFYFLCFPFFSCLSFHTILSIHLPFSLSCTFSILPSPSNYSYLFYSMPSVIYPPPLFILLFFFSFYTSFPPFSHPNPSRK